MVMLLELDDTTREDLLLGAPIPDCPMSFTLYLHDVDACQVLAPEHRTHMWFLHTHVAHRCLWEQSCTYATPKVALPF